MKFDKEFLLKHLFWILTGLALVFAAVDLFYLKFSIAGEIDEKEKALKKQLGDLLKSGEVKGPLWVAQAREKAEIQKGLRTVVWKEAAAGQNQLMTWPEGFEQVFHYRDGLFALAIKAERKPEVKVEEKKGEPKGEDSKANDKKAEEEAVGTFEGTLTSLDKDWMEVAGRDSQVKRFQRTARVKISLSADGKSNDNEFWSALKERDWVSVTYQRGKYFADEMTDSERDLYAQTYADQVRGILKQVNPYTERGEGVVQLKGWPYQENEKGEALPPRTAPFLTYVGPREDGKADIGTWITQRNPDMFKEVWTAQEDLWIQRELYRLIGLANSYVSNFKGAGGDGKGKAFAFHNPYWELKLTLSPAGTLEGKIKNISTRRQRLDVNFLVKLRKDRDPEKILVEGEPVDPGIEQDLRPQKLRPGLQPTGIYGVEQVLTWETAAVKRIDQVSIGKGVPAPAAGPAGSPTGGPGPKTGGSFAFQPGDKSATSQSHRTYVIPVKPYPFPTEKKEEAAPPPDPSVPGGGVPGKGAADATSPNGFTFDRYIEVSEQARRLPVGVVLIVDQEHVGRVQAAFADSILRFGTTQVILNRYPNPLRPSESATLVAATPGAPGVGFNPGAGRYPGFGPPTGPGAASQSSAASGGEENESNMELVLYGIVSLYERFPPRTGAPAP